MKNTLGTGLAVTLFGESHGEMIGAVLDGLSPGIRVDESYIADRLAQRRPFGGISTSRVEADPFRIVSGVLNGRTTGSPLCILIPNQDMDSDAYEPLCDLPRPGHADYAARCKYHGFEDPRGGGHFSGRITAALVAAGAVVRCALDTRGIAIATHIAQLGDVCDRPFRESPEQDMAVLDREVFAALSEEAREAMIRTIEQAAADNDSVGGVLETIVTGVPAGIGEPWFDTLEGMLAHGLFSIPGVKGLQFGAGFDLVCVRGSAFNDAFCMDGDRIRTKTNHSGGINGGISNGMPLLFRTAVRPTPSIAKPQNTVDLGTMQEKVLTIEGRHDPAIIHRVRAVVDAVTALVLGDALTIRYGSDYLGDHHGDEQE